MGARQAQIVVKLLITITNRKDDITEMVDVCVFNHTLTFLLIPKPFKTWYPVDNYERACHSLFKEG